MSRRKRKVVKKNTTLTRDGILKLRHAELIDYYDPSCGYFDTLWFLKWGRD